MIPMNYMDRQVALIQYHIERNRHGGGYLFDKNEMQFIFDGDEEIESVHECVQRGVIEFPAPVSPLRLDPVGSFGHMVPIPRPETIRVFKIPYTGYRRWMMRTKNVTLFFHVNKYSVVQAVTMIAWRMKMHREIP